MPVIKRYPNRKLYDTEAKQYITLLGIGSLIREGREVQVVDHASGEDLTCVTLTQVIFELERKRTGFLPQAVLTGLIQAGGETLGSLRRSLAFPLGLARHVDEEIEGASDDQIERVLTSRGVPTRDQFQQLVEQLDRLSEKQDGLSLAGH
jgi:polyhydroxyalkanoate synthesis repressor PhaR